MILALSLKSELYYWKCLFNFNVVNYHKETIDLKVLLPEEIYNSVPFPNFRRDQIPNIRESCIFIENLFIDVIVKGPFFAEGNRGIENHLFVRCRSLEAGLVLQVFGCRVRNNGYKRCNHV